MSRFLDTLEIVSREGVHLDYSRGHLCAQPIDRAWVEALAQNPEMAEKLEAFVSRFGRMQDTIADKLLPRWLTVQAETPGSVLDVLNRAERLGVVENVGLWLEARKLRNRLVHEYMKNADVFAEDLLLAREYSQLMFDVFNRVREHASARMNIADNLLPPKFVSGS